MDDDNKPVDAPENREDVQRIDTKTERRKKITEERVDMELDQSFPASDPPSYSTPGNDDIIPGKQDIRESPDADQPSE